MHVFLKETKRFESAILSKNLLKPWCKQYCILLGAIDHENGNSQIKDKDRSSIVTVTIGSMVGSPVQQLLRK